MVPVQGSTTTDLLNAATREGAMHAVLITFHSDVSLDDLREPFLAGAPAIRDSLGLISKTWLHRDSTLGGFYLFTDRESALAYLDGPIITDLKATPVFSEIAIQEFAVAEEFSALTNGVPQYAAR
jgi:hypothetical protein